jgi:hypothetical protein
MVFRIPSGTLPMLFAVSLAGTGPDPRDVIPAAPQSRAEVAMIPNGAVADAGWALARLNDSDNTANQSFVYPETTNPVRLYLIDTGVAHTGTWFAANSNLTVEHVELIRSHGDPMVSNAVEHGTRMLSLIAGPETGAAIGTPIQLVSFNVYPNGEGTPTTSGRMEDAIFEAIDYQAAHPGIPGVICLASGSMGPASSGLFEEVVEQAVAAGITVIVSAGNEGANASNYVPSAYGTRPGVICVGASDANNQHLPSTNFGPAVDLYAPGVNVRTLALPSPQPGVYQAMNGSSPATALTTAAAIIELSKNPALTPAKVEQALTQRAETAVTYSEPATGNAALVQVEADPEGDSDGDGSADLLEAFFGSNPADPAAMPATAVLARTPGQVQLGFSMAADLFNPATPYVLGNGATWRVRWSPNLTDWHDATGTLVTGAPVGGKIPVSFQMPTAAPSCFLRIEVKPAP